MKVLLAEKCGFCPGVRSAIQLARQTLETESPVFSLGQIIHNKDIVDELADAGLESVESVDQLDSGTVIVRSHGATKQEFVQMRAKGLHIVDATCVLVKRVQKIAQMLSEEGYKVVIIGDKDHPEIKAVVGYAEDIEVVANENDIDKLSKHSKLGVICQTTESPDHFGEMVGLIAKKGFSELKVINTLCRETIKRQESAVDLCRKVDVMFVLGGLNSANTKKLAELCKNHNNLTFHLQNSSELDIKVLSGKAVAGVTAGASTPDRVVKEFVETLKKINTDV
jgi:(E)-4-hydroxy-3-methyl-but-2-enyl pyrophosphate reductase